MEKAIPKNLEKQCTTNPTVDFYCSIFLVLPIISDMCYWCCYFLEIVTSRSCQGFATHPLVPFCTFRAARLGHLGRAASANKSLDCSDVMQSVCRLATGVENRGRRSDGKVRMFVCVLIIVFTSGVWLNQIDCLTFNRMMVDDWHPLHVAWWSRM